MHYGDALIHFFLVQYFSLDINIDTRALSLMITMMIMIIISEHWISFKRGDVSSPVERHFIEKQYRMPSPFFFNGRRRD